MDNEEKKLPEVIENKSEVLSNPTLHFKEELQMLENEMSKAENLYEELKIHFDNVKNSRTPGSLRFITEQVRNLISLRTHKTDLIKSKINVKKSIADIIIKNKNLDNNISETDLRELLSLISQKNNADFIDVDIEDNLENRLLELQEKGDIVFEGELSEIVNKPKNLISEDCKIVVDMDGNLYSINESYEIVEYLNIDIGLVMKEDENGEIKAFDKDGNEIEVVDI